MFEFIEEFPVIEEAFYTQNNTFIKCKYNGNIMIVPISQDNIHYLNVMKWVELGNTIQNEG